MSRITNRTTRKAPPGCLIPFGLIFLLAGLAIIWFAWTKILAKVGEVRQWTETPCRVTRWESGIETSQGDIYKAVPQIAYEYEAAGRTFTGTTLDAASSANPDLNEIEAQGVAARLGPAGCYVNPAAPGESSFQRPGYTTGGAVLAFGILFAGIGGAIMLGGVLSTLLPGTGGSRGGCAKTLLAPVLFGLFAAGGLAVWKFALHDQPDWKNISTRMVEVPAKILASGVSRHTSSGKNSKTTYKAKIAWEYQFDGRTWRSGWLDFDRGSISSSNAGKAQSAVSRYRAGSTAKGWVDPQAPWQAVLEKDGGSRWWLWLFPIIFGGIGLLGLAGWLLKLTALGAAIFGTRRNNGL